MRPQCQILKNEANFSFVGWKKDLLIFSGYSFIDFNNPHLWNFQSGDQSQYGSFTTPRRANHTGCFCLLKGV